VKEQVKSAWFGHYYPPPSKPGVYLTRSTYTGTRTLCWWRAFDGENWHAGIMAISPQGELKSVAPEYDELVQNPVFGEHLSIEWCGVSQ